MKKLKVLFVALAMGLTCVALMAQQPQTPARGGTGRMGGGRMGGRMAGPQVPAATGPMLDIVNKIADAINKGDADALNKMIAPDCVYLDEDGHAPAVSRWVTNLTTGGKKIEITQTHGQMWDDAGWVSFNYTVTETYQGAPKAVKGTASLVVKKQPSGDWQLVMIHGALYQKVAGLTGR